jgi:pimeloyl-ACP methyl ester carboxylesterase
LSAQLGGDTHPVKLSDKSTFCHTFDPQVEALSVVSTFVRIDLRGYRKSSAPGADGYRHCDDVAAVVERWDSKVPWLEAFRSAKRSAALFTEMVDRYSGWHFENRDPARWAEADAVSRLKDITAPVLVVCGEHDLLDHRLMGEEIADRMPNAGRTLLAGLRAHAELGRTPSVQSARDRLPRDGVPRRSQLIGSAPTLRP